MLRILLLVYPKNRSPQIISGMPSSISPCAVPSVIWLKMWQMGYLADDQMIYRKQSLRNRYCILAVNGPLWLTIPVQSTNGEFRPFDTIKISSQPWRKVHWRSICSAYARAPYWEHYQEGLSQIINGHQIYLVEIFEEFMTWVHSCGIKKEIMGSSKSTQLKTIDIWDPGHIWPKQLVYQQVFSDRHPFQSNLSVIDLVMNLGPKAQIYIEHVTIETI